MGKQIKLPNIDFVKVGNTLVESGKTAGAFVKNHATEFLAGALAGVTIDSQLKWALLERPALREAYVRGKINEELDDVLSEAEATFDRFARDYIVVFN